MKTQKITQKITDTVAGGSAEVIKTIKIPENTVGISIAADITQTPAANSVVNIQIRMPNSSFAIVQNLLSSASANWGVSSIVSSSVDNQTTVGIVGEYLQIKYTAHATLSTTFNFTILYTI